MSTYAQTGPLSTHQHMFFNTDEGRRISSKVLATSENSEFDLNRHHQFMGDFTD